MTATLNMRKEEGACCSCSARGVPARTEPGVPALEPGFNFAGIDKCTIFPQVGTPQSVDKGCETLK